MKNKSSQEKYITEATFKKESDWVHKEFDSLHQKIDNVALGLLKTNEGLERVETNMFTKSDGNQIMDRLDYMMKKMSVFDVEEGVQSLHLIEVTHRVDDHERDS